MARVLIEFDANDDEISQVLGVLNGVVTIRDPVTVALAAGNTSGATGTTKKEIAAQKRRDKAAKKKADAEAAAAEADDDPLGLNGESETAAATKEDVRAALIEYRNKLDTAGEPGNDGARKLLGSFGAETLGGLDAEKYAEVITACQK